MESCYQQCISSSLFSVVYNKVESYHLCCFVCMDDLIKEIRLSKMAELWQQYRRPTTRAKKRKLWHQLMPQQVIAVISAVTKEFFGEQVCSVPSFQSVVDCLLASPVIYRRGSRSVRWHTYMSPHVRHCVVFSTCRVHPPLHSFLAANAIWQWSLRNDLAPARPTTDVRGNQNRVVES